MKIKLLVAGIAVASLSSTAFAGGHMMDGKHGKHHKKDCDKHSMISYDFMELGYQNVDSDDNNNYDEAKGFYGKFGKKLDRHVFFEGEYESLEDKGRGVANDSVDYENLTLGAGYIVKMNDLVDGQLHVIPKLDLTRTKVGDAQYGQYTLNRYSLGVEARYAPAYATKVEMSAGYKYTDDMSDKKNGTGEDLLHEASVYTLGAKYKVTKKMHVNLNYDIVDAEKSDSSGFDLNGDTLKVGVSYNY